MLNHNFSRTIKCESLKFLQTRARLIFFKNYQWVLGTFLKRSEKIK